MRDGQDLSLTATDLFCGGGGSGLGLDAAGVDVVMAANHWDLAIRTHQTNFPNTKHDIANISETDPRRYPWTNILWASPSCTKHSKAQGIADRQRDSLPGADWKPMPKDAAERSRATMWDVIRFAEYHPYDAIIVENVVEVTQWVLYGAWLAALQQLGYRYREVYLNSMHTETPGMAGAPQSRDRVYIVAWRKGIKAPNVDPRPEAFCAGCDCNVRSVQTFKPGRTAGKYRQQYTYRCPTCSDVVEPDARPALEAIDWSLQGERIGSRKRPLADGTRRRTEAGRARYGTEMVVPLDRANDPTSKGDGGEMCTPFTEPLRTLTTKGHQSIVLAPHHGDPSALLVPYYRTGVAKPASEPLGTITTVDRHALIQGQVAYEDLLFRMLEPHEGGAASAFAQGYKVLGNKREQVRQYGNAVTPPAAHLIAKALIEVLGTEVAAA